MSATVWKLVTHRAPSIRTILCALVHVAGLQRGWCLGVGGTDGVLHHAGARGIMGDALHSAHLRAPTAGHRAGIPLTGSPAGKTNQEGGETGDRSQEMLLCSTEKIKSSIPKRFFKESSFHLNFLRGAKNVNNMICAF